MPITVEQIQLYALCAQMLISVGGVAVEQVRAMFGHIMPEPQLNAMLQDVMADATRRKALAQADAGGAPDPLP